MPELPAPKMSVAAVSGKGPAAANLAEALDAVFDATRSSAPHLGSESDQTRDEKTLLLALVDWLGLEETRRLAQDKEMLLERLDRDVANLDALLTRQVEAIIQHPRFQALEAAWRGLRFLASTAAEAVGAKIKIRVLSADWKSLTKDLERAIEFDQSQLFGKIYSDEFGTPGGEPFSVLIGDYEIRHRPGPEHRVNDVEVLAGIASVAAAAFAPFVCGAHPALFGLDDFRQLSGPSGYKRIFRQLEYLSWNGFRDSPDARFVGVTLPRILLRGPYEDDGTHVDGFRWAETADGPGESGCLWGNAAFAFGAVLIRAFAESGWLADIRGVREHPSTGGGIVRGLPVQSFSTDSHRLIPKSSLDFIISDQRERELAELGFIPLCHCHDTELCAFFSTPSVQRPKTDFDSTVANVNARLSAMLNYMLCVSRFGQYLKVIERDKLAAFQTPSACEAYLKRWLLNYVAASDETSFEQKARFPLREASVEVLEQPGKPGTYRCVMHLRPHFQLEQVISTVRLVTEFGAGDPG